MTRTAFLLGVCALAACASDTTDSDDTGSSTQDSGIDGGTEPADGDDPNAPLEGTWRTENFRGGAATLTLEHGSFAAEFIATESGPEVTGDFEAVDGVLRLDDTGGAYACPPGERSGAYRYTVEETMLTLTATDDPCAPRSEFMQSTWLRQSDGSDVASAQRR